VKYPLATPAQIAFFEEHGWLVVEDADDTDEIAEVDRRCQVILDKKARLRLGLGAGKSKDEREFKIVQGSPTLVAAHQGCALPPLGDRLRVDADGARR
jgi:hypothetical protein